MSLVQADTPQSAYPVPFLIAANSVPLFGVLFFGWSLPVIIFLYWAENVIVGGFNLLKLLRVGGLLAVPLCLFFTFHYGMFCYVHGMILAGIFFPHHGPLPHFANREAAELLHRYWFPLAALALSHGAAFFADYVKGDAWRQMDLKHQMSQPYPRIIVLHLVILLGGFASMLLGSNLFMLVLLILLKTGLDARLRSMSAPTGSRPAAAPAQAG